LIAVYETQLVVQCAADPDGSADAYTRAAIAAAGAVPILAPVRIGTGIRPRSGYAGPVDVTFVRLPMLFGRGDRRWDRWPPRLLLAAARGGPLPPPPAELVGAPVLSVRVAVAALLTAVADPDRTGEPSGHRVIDAPPQ